jgi:hypothetical protein
MHHGPMRTTVTLDDEIHELALVYARARDISLGAALSELVRGSQAVSAKRTRAKVETAPNGLPIIRAQGRKLTPEMVKEAQEDDFE